MHQLILLRCLHILMNSRIQPGTQRIGSQIEYQCVTPVNSLVIGLQFLFLLLNKSDCNKFLVDTELDWINNPKNLLWIKLFINVAGLQRMFNYCNHHCIHHLIQYIHLLLCFLLSTPLFIHVLLIQLLGPILFVLTEIAVPQILQVLFNWYFLPKFPLILRFTTRVVQVFEYKILQLSSLLHSPLLSLLIHNILRSLVLCSLSCLEP